LWHEEEEVEVVRLRMPPVVRPVIEAINLAAGHLMGKIQQHHQAQEVVMAGAEVMVGIQVVCLVVAEVY
jgi:hypothetical protein